MAYLRTADEVNKMKFFRSGRVGDGDTIFVNTACRQRPLAGQASTLDVGGRAAEGGRSNSDGW